MTDIAASIDSTEPLYTGLVEAESAAGSGNRLAYNKFYPVAKDLSGPENRRYFNRVDINSPWGIWVDRYDNRYLYTDLSNVVILAKGVSEC